MSIAEFIRESVLRPRLKQAGALVVYDADKPENTGQELVGPRGRALALRVVQRVRV